jgi:hypothetical protein
MTLLSQIFSGRIFVQGFDAIALPIFNREGDRQGAKEKAIAFCWSDAVIAQTTLRF